MGMSAITVRPVASRKDEMRFIKFQWEPYRGNPYWVPPLIMDRKKLIDRAHNPFYKHAAMELFLAEREGKTVGRIGAIINDNHNKEHNENIGFFGFFECIDDQQVANALFDAARKWITARGATAIRGPASPSVNDDYGLLIDGFDKPPAILMVYNPPYYQTLIEKYGFRKAKDLYAYRVKEETVLVDKLVRVSEMIKKREGLVFRTIDMKNFHREVATIRELYNKGWERNWGEVPMTEEEFAYVAKDLKPIVDPELVIVAELRGRPVGFALSLPDLNMVFRKNKHGWLIPGLIRLLLFKRSINFVRIIILGVLPEYLNTGIGGVLFYETARRGIARGYNQGEASWVNEDNLMMNRGAAMMNGERWKTYRVFELPLK